MVPTRRDLMLLAARAALLPGAADFLSAWQSAGDHRHGLQAPPQPPLLIDYKPKFFAPDDFAALQAFTEILIPADDTPGAREAHCAAYIDFLMQASDSMPSVQKQWRDTMVTLRQLGFHAADRKTREELVAAMSAPERDPAKKHPGYTAYRLIKEQNTFAFYTSRAGMIETLDYRGNSYNATFPACDHPEHRQV